MPDVSIEIGFYSNNRIEISSILGGWDKKRYDEVEQELRKRGFTDIRLNRIATENGIINKNITNVQIGTSEETKAQYKEGKCYVSKSETIWIEHYAWNINIGEKPSAFTDEKYEEVLRILKSKGFSSIVLKRTNNVPWFKKAGNVKSVKINGNDNYKKDDVFEFDVPIEIVVYTEKTGFDEITLIEE